MEQFSYRVTLSFCVHWIPAIAISYALRNTGRFKTRGERNKLFAALAVFASSDILSCNYLLLTGRSRKRSPSLASVAPFLSSLPSFLGASLFSLSLSLSLPPLPPCSLTLTESCTLHSPMQLLLMHSAASLSTRPIFAKIHEHKKSAHEKTEPRIKKRKKKYSRFIYLCALQSIKTRKNYIWNKNLVLIVDRVE